MALRRRGLLLFSEQLRKETLRTPDLLVAAWKAKACTSAVAEDESFAFKMRLDPAVGCALPCSPGVLVTRW